MSNVEKYYVQGFRMVVSPNRVADCDIYFRTIGHSPNIVGVDLYHPQTHAHLGFVYPQNIDIPVKHAMREYIKKHHKLWVRVHMSAAREDYIKKA